MLGDSVRARLCVKRGPMMAPAPRRARVGGGCQARVHSRLQSRRHRRLQSCRHRRRRHHRRRRRHSHHHSRRQARPLRVYAGTCRWEHPRKPPPSLHPDQSSLAQAETLEAVGNYLEAVGPAGLALASERTAAGWSSTGLHSAAARPLAPSLRAPSLRHPCASPAQALRAPSRPPARSCMDREGGCRSHAPAASWAGGGQRPRALCQLLDARLRGGALEGHVIL